MSVLEIKWQRLVNKDGLTCDRCSATGKAVEEAADELNRSLSRLGIRVILKKEPLGEAEFSKEPLESNRIWIAGVPLEAWLSASSGQSPCCSACGDADCRTIIVEGRSYEAVPKELIVKAGMLAAAQMIESEADEDCCRQRSAPESGCCSPPSKRR